jgi:hypothetical protein
MDSVMATICQCMQRGAEPLSLIDLIENDMLTFGQAAWLISRIEKGSSWLVGAAPGNAGKTTLMNALLVFLPAREEATLAHPGAQWKSFGPGTCVVTEEISDHIPGHYLWEEDVRGLTLVPGQGGRITSTIHADTLEEAREQVARQCGAGEEGLASFGMFIPIEVSFAEESNHRGGLRERARHRRPISSRSVRHIHYRSGNGWKTIGRDVRLTAKQELIADFLKACCQSGARSCQALRSAWLADR